MRATSNRTRSSGLKLKESRHRFDIREKNLYCKGGESLEKVA